MNYVLQNISYTYRRGFRRHCCNSEIVMMVSMRTRGKPRDQCIIILQYHCVYNESY